MFISARSSPIWNRPSEFLSNGAMSLDATSSSLIAGFWPDRRLITACSAATDKLPEPAVSKFWNACSLGGRKSCFSSSADAVARDGTPAEEADAAGTDGLLVGFGFASLPAEEADAAETDGLFVGLGFASRSDLPPLLPCSPVPHIFENSSYWISPSPFESNSAIMASMSLSLRGAPPLKLPRTVRSSCTLREPEPSLSKKSNASRVVIGLAPALVDFQRNLIMAAGFMTGKAQERCRAKLAPPLQPRGFSVKHQSRTIDPKRDTVPENSRELPL